MELAGIILCVLGYVGGFFVLIEYYLGRISFKVYSQLFGIICDYIIISFDNLIGLCGCFSMLRRRQVV